MPQRFLGRICIYVSLVTGSRNNTFWLYSEIQSKAYFPNPLYIAFFYGPSIYRL